MKRLSLVRLFAVIAAATLWPSVAAAQAISKEVNHANSLTPIRIALLSDHYTDQGKFDNDVQNFIIYGLLAHDYYGARRDALQIESFFDTLDAGKTSDFNFDPNTPTQDCDLTWDQSADDNKNTAVLVNNVVKDFNPAHTVVIGDYGYNMGCTSGNWSYVGRDAMGSDVLPHELGHGLGHLKDEWVAGDRVSTSHPGIPLLDTRNCYHTSNGATPPWKTPTDPAYVPGADSVSGCDLYGVDVVHAFPDPYNGTHYCLMGATQDAKFCPVCTRFMEERFSDENPEMDNPQTGGGGPPTPPPPTPNPTPGPPADLRIIKASFVQPPPKIPGPAPVPGAPARPATPIIRLVVAFNPSNGTITAKKGVAITSRYTPSHRRLGVYVYEIVDGNKPNGQQTLDVGVFPSDLFTARSYQGGLAHQTTGAHTTDVTIQVPFVTDAMARDPKSAISIRIWQLMPGVNNPLITPAVLTTLKGDKKVEQKGEITPQQLRSAM